MNSEERFKHLESTIDALVARFSAEAARHKRTALVLRILSVCVAAAITVLLGIHWEDPNRTTLAGNIALVLGSAITVLSSYEAFFDPRALWIRETITFARLKDLKRDVHFWRAGQPPDALDLAEIASFKARLDSVLNETLRHWMKLKGAPDFDANGTTVTAKHSAAKEP